MKEVKLVMMFEETLSRLSKKVVHKRQMTETIDG